jgi:hypothetical protein
MNAEKNSYLEVLMTEGFIPDSRPFRFVSGKILISLSKGLEYLIDS